MRTGQASGTAVLMCQGRAVAHGRILPERFSDPTASPMLAEDERAIVDLVRAEDPPSVYRERAAYEMVRAVAEVSVPRTVAIDDAVRERAAPQVVILGAGLDGRAWRMPELAGVEVFEVDHPASQADKRERTAALPAPAGAPHFVPVDFAHDRLADVLAAAGHRDDTPTTWVWEGVVPYLTPAQVTATLTELAARSAPGSRLVINYQERSARISFGRMLGRAVSALVRYASPLAGEPWRSTWTPDRLRRLLGRHAFTVRHDDDLLTLATAYAMPAAPHGSLSNGRVLIADR